MSSSASVLPRLGQQVERLIALGVHEIGGLSARELRAAVLDRDGVDGLLVLHPEWAPASSLAPLLEHDGKRGFVVADMTDVDGFSPIASVTLPTGPVYRVDGADRGDEWANWSPTDALPAIHAAGRTPLTLHEGIGWLLQRPDVLERGRGFMTVGSRRRRPDGSLDPRTPAVWISNGTGRDGPARRNAPKVGWCWAGNRHTWLGFASALRRVPIDHCADVKSAVHESIRG